MVDKVTLVQVFLPILRVFPVTIIPPMCHTLLPVGKMGEV